MENNDRGAWATDEEKKKKKRKNEKWKRWRRTGDAKEG